MRKLTFVGIIGLTAALGCETGLAPEPASLGSMLDPDGNAVAHFSTVSSAVGSGHVRRSDGSLREFTISAVQHANGSVSGQYNLTIVPVNFFKDLDITPPLVSFHGTITCMKVVGNSAYLGGVVDKDQHGDLVLGQNNFTGVAIELIDNGTGPDAEPDQISSLAVYFPGSPTTPQDYCDNPSPGTVFPIDQGNITVR